MLAERLYRRADPQPSWQARAWAAYPEVRSEAMRAAWDHVAELVRAEAERIEGDLALAVSLQDFDRIDHLTVVEDRRRLDAWTRTVASSWPDPL